MRETSGKHGEEVDEEESSSSSNNTLGAADSLLLCLSILRERKKERKREREIKERSLSPLFAALFLLSVKKVPTKEIKIGPQTSLFSVRFGHPKRFFLYF